ncbi:sulfotransferase [Cypionkella sp.]|uniref:tetratricopeptide repeat-containing sulfotransferase family protein n=1 Tax=Cypionkella sp. TaxID=2811411 RepID=UPI0037503F61
MRLNIETMLRKAASRIAQKQPLEAASIYTEILQKFPSNIRAKTGLTELNKIGNEALPHGYLESFHTLVRNGRAKEALSQVHALQTMAFGSAELHSLLGQAYLILGQNSKADFHVKAASQLQPGQVRHQLSAGNAAFLASNFAMAEYYFETALALAPENEDLLNNLGMALAAQMKFDAAETIFAKAAVYHPDSAKIAYNRANALRDAGEHERSIVSYKRAIELNPQYYNAANNLGTVLHQLGQDNEAEAAYALAVEIRPDYAQAHRNLSAVHKYTSGDQLIETLDNELSKATDPRSLMYLCFARSKAHEDLGEYQNAFKRLVEANALRKKLIGYDISVDQLLFATIERLFSCPLPPLEVPSSETRPVFVVGMMRSGTTLVEQIISSHSAVYGAGELEQMSQLCLPFMERFHSQSILPDQNQLNELRQSYISYINKLSSGAEVVTDKMPINFRWIGFILAAFPDAKIIHLKRDPIATCWSIFKHYFSSDGNGYAFDLQDVATYWHLYSNLMAHWDKLYPGKILTVPYEDLTEDLEKWSRKIIEFSGMSWQDACLDFHLNSRAVRTASASQVKRKIYKGSSDAWRSYEENLAPLISSLAKK